MKPHPATLGLDGRQHFLARIAWVALVMPMLGLFIAAVPANYHRLSNPPEVVRESLSQLGLSVSSYAVYLTALLVVFSLVCFVVAAVIFWRKSDDGMALFVSFMLVLMGAVNAPNVEALKELRPALTFPVELSSVLLLVSLILFLPLFPDGRFVPRWTRTLVLVWIAALALTLFLTRYSPATDPPGAVFVLVLGGAVTGVIAQVYRYVRVSDQTQRQQTKWVVFGTAAAFTGQIVFLLLSPFFPPSLSPPGLQATPYDLAGVTGVTVSFFLVPLSIGIAILRYRLWDIDFLINRALVYGTLTTCIVGIYVLLVGGLGTLLQASGNRLISLVATGFVAVLFAPLRDRLQRGVNRLMYGERDDPYAVVSRLGERLEAALAPEAVLPTIVGTIREALKLPYAAIALPRDEGFEVAAAFGKPIDDPLRVPLTYQGEAVGELLLGPRAPGEEFSATDRRLLNDLAHHAGVAVHGVRVMADLRRSRERLVLAREEERRRLRRDLHDELAPTLAALGLSAATVGELIESAPKQAAAANEKLRAALRDTVGDVRRLAYDLRPPALDELGLVEAIKERAARYSSELQVKVETSELPQTLPAAVEVAAYRIVQEALMNVLGHAKASTCAVRLACPEGRALEVEVTDDGVGMPDLPKPGIGLRSIRERAVELGGTCEFRRASPTGTRVFVRLPLAEPGGRTEERSE